MSEVAHFGMALIARAGDQAFERLITVNADEENIISRAMRIARECPRRGDVGLLAPDDFPESGRVMVPSVVLLDLLTVVSSRMVKP